MITSIARKLLLTLGYPRLEKNVPIQCLVGQHSVGAMQIRIPDATACQIFYPTANAEVNNKNSKNKQFIPYWRPEAVQGLIDYLNFGNGLLQLLSETSHPCHWEVEPLKLDENSSTFPLVMFSHGLAGTYEMYTELCSHIASLGYCVVAIEHEDGSAAYAERQDGTPIPYQRPNDEAYSRQKVLNFRTSMLQERVKEMEKTMQYFVHEKQHQANKESNDNDRLLSKIIHVMDLNQVHLVGHSFGGATQLLAAQQWTTTSSRREKLSLKSVTVLDAWAFALQDDVLNQGLRDTKVPLLSILSESWTTNPERKQLLQYLQNSSARVHSYYAKHSVHQSFSDSEAWFPSFVARKVYNRGRHEKRHYTIRSVVKAWKQLIKSGTSKINIDDDDDDILQPFGDFTFTNKRNDGKSKSHEDSQQQKPILVGADATTTSLSSSSS